MLSNRVKRNFWLVLAILSFCRVITRIIGVVYGNVEWWKMVLAIVVMAFCTKFYLCYRHHVKNGNLFGKVELFGE